MTCLMGTITTFYLPDRVIASLNSSFMILITSSTPACPYNEINRKQFSQCKCLKIRIYMTQVDDTNCQSEYSIREFQQNSALQ